MANWNDDERDTRCFCAGKTTNSRYTEDVSVCQALRDYFKDVRESQYTWTTEDYNKELKKRMQARVPSLITCPSPVQSPKKEQTLLLEKPAEATDDIDEDDDDGTEPAEFNNEIMDQQIYKKSMYS